MISSRLSEKRVTSCQTTARMNKELINKLNVAKLKSSCTKNQPANNLPSELYKVLESSVERLKLRMEIKVEKETWKDKRVELKKLKAKHQLSIKLLKAELTNQLYLVELQTIEMQIKAPGNQDQMQSAMMAVLQNMQN